MKIDYFIRKFFEYILKRKSLEIIKYNKNIQKRIDISKSLQTLFWTIFIYRIRNNTNKNEYGKFISFELKDEEHYYIYFNNNKDNEIKVTSIKENDNVSKINII